ncbi:MAG TPA: hypothetical protein VLY24_01870 [Bryobacteraceae bacterium]|nr:hypothetical protein [Bryobacteraceae bacterium]
MPAKPGKDDQVFVKLFLSAYEDASWADAEVIPLDQLIDGAVEAFATRKSDKKTLAIEHTLIEPFVGDRRDFAAFRQVFLEIENDATLLVPDHGIVVHVPVGTLDGQRPPARKKIVEAVHAWIVANRLRLREGEHEYACPVPGNAGKMDSVVTLTVKFTPFHQKSPGMLSVRRQQIINDLDKVIAKALTNKLPKLMATPAKKRLLFLERDQFTFFPEQILDELDRQQAAFPLLNDVDEIWILETVGYRPEGHLNFDLYKGKHIVASLTFRKGVLTGQSKDGMPVPMN